MANTYTVAGASQLSSALQSARAGDTILLEPGRYGDLDLSGVQFNNYVTLRSANPNNEAKFETIRMHDTSYIRIDDVHVDYPSFGGNGTRVVNIDDGSHHIEILNSEINARDGNGNYNNYNVFGISVRNSSHITVENNYIHDAQNGFAAFSSSHVVFTENYIDHIGADHMKGGGLTHFEYSNNTGGKNLFPSPTAHADFMQFQGSSSNGVISGNVYVAGTSERAQGIFMNGGSYQNVTIEDNILFTGKLNGIKILAGSGNVVRNNTVLSTPGAGHESSVISVPGGTVVQDNIYTRHYGAGFSGSNVIVQHDDPRDVNYYGDLFVNATGGLGRTDLEDLLPKPGSVIEGKGAYERLLEVLDMEPPTSSAAPPSRGNSGNAAPPAASEDPEPAPTPDPEPTPPPAPVNLPDAPSSDEAVVLLQGDYSFSGARDVKEYAHSEDLELDEATIAMTFNADSVSGRKGLMSKDASGYAGGGNHFAAWIENGTLNIRFQDGSSDAVVSVDGIRAGRDYDLQVRFGDGTVEVLLDGVEVGSAVFDMNWEDNGEVLQIGALGWSSASGASGAVHGFDGTISDVAIIAGKPAYAEVEAIRTGTPIQDELPEPVVTPPADPEPTPEPEPTPAPPAPDPDPVPDPVAPAPTPDPVDTAPEPDLPAAPGSDAAVLLLEGDYRFTNARQTLEYAHGTALELDAATIAMTFNADVVAGRKGLMSKDASGHGTGDHFSAWIEGGTLNVRFQDDQSEAVISVDGIRAGRDYDMQVRFGDGTVEVLLDGVSVGSAAFDASWADNTEVLQVGGLGWSSASGAAGIVHGFDGTISDVAIVAGTPDYNTVETIRGGTPVSDQPSPTPTPTPTPEPTPVETPPATGTLAFALSGDTEISDRSDVREVAHTEAMEMTSGRLELAFNADTVSGKRGLLSKDAYGYGADGNHISVWIQNGVLNFRVQDEDETITIKKAGIRPDRDYELSASFDEDEIFVYLDGVRIGNEAIGLDLTENQEMLQVGALGWASAPGEDGFQAVFDGTISDVRLVSESGPAPTGSAVSASVYSEYLQGGAGDEALAGEGGNDVFDSGAGDDTLDGHGGNDELNAGIGDDVLRGGDGNDGLFGKSGADLLVGGAGNDTLEGGAGEDTLDGGTGNDELRGGFNQDTFVVRAGDGDDVIVDFDIGRDLIAIESGAAAMADLSFQTVSGGVEVAFADVTLLVEGVSLADLQSAQNFDF
ncbi:MAG: LamG domain-containing protein [Pseudomonadota bacterium]